MYRYMFTCIHTILYHDNSKSVLRISSECYGMPYKDKHLIICRVLPIITEYCRVNSSFDTYFIASTYSACVTVTMPVRRDTPPSVTCLNYRI